MNHSCENTSLQNVSVENLQFTRVTFAVARTKTGQRVTVSGVSRFVVWWSFGTEPHTSPVELPILLVRNVRRCEGLAETVHNLHKEEVAQQPPPPPGDYSHRPSMGLYCNGYTLCL